MTTNTTAPSITEQLATALAGLEEVVLGASKTAGQASVPEGWRLVPVEPTPEMRGAGGHANSEWLNDNAPLGEVHYAMPMQSVWAAMLASSPQPPAQSASAKDTP